MNESRPWHDWICWCSFVRLTHLCESRDHTIWDVTDTNNWITSLTQINMLVLIYVTHTFVWVTWLTHTFVWVTWLTHTFVWVTWLTQFGTWPTQMNESRPWHKWICWYVFMGLTHLSVSRDLHNSGRDSRQSMSRVPNINEYADVYSYDTHICVSRRTKPSLEPSGCRTRQPGRTWLRGARQRSAVTARPLERTRAMRMCQRGVPV